MQGVNKTVAGLLIVIAVLGAVIGGLVVYIVTGRSAGQAVSAPPPAPLPSGPVVNAQGETVQPAAAQPVKQQLLPCGHPAMLQTRAGNIVDATCTEGHSWMYGDGKWYNPNIVPAPAPIR